MATIYIIFSRMSCHVLRNTANLNCDYIQYIQLYSHTNDKYYIANLNREIVYIVAKHKTRTHSDSDESLSSVFVSPLTDAPFRRSRLAPPPRPSLEEGPREEAESPDSWLCMRLMAFLSAMGDSCFFFRIPACHGHTLQYAIVNRFGLKNVWTRSLVQTFVRLRAGVR